MVINGCPFAIHEYPLLSSIHYCDFHNYEYTEVQIPTCKTAFSLPSINDNQSVPLIFLTDGSENANSNGQLQRRCPRNNENRSNRFTLPCENRMIQLITTQDRHIRIYCRFVKSFCISFHPANHLLSSGYYAWISLLILL